MRKAATPLPSRDAALMPCDLNSLQVGGFSVQVSGDRRAGASGRCPPGFSEGHGPPIHPRCGLAPENGLQCCCETSELQGTFRAITHGQTDTPAPVYKHRGCPPRARMPAHPLFPVPLDHEYNDDSDIFTISPAHFDFNQAFFCAPTYHTNILSISMPPKKSTASSAAASKNKAPPSHGSYQVCSQKSGPHKFSSVSNIL
jgi:hypothetical protein